MKTLTNGLALDRLLEPVSDSLNEEAARKLISLKADKKTQAYVAKLAEKCTEGEHQQRDGAEGVQVREEIREALVGGEGRKPPLREQPEREPGDSAEERERSRSAAGTKAGGVAQQSGWKDERVEPLPGDPEKGEVADASADGGTEQAKGDGLWLS